MALRKIVTVGDPILTKVCRPVTKFDQKLAILIEDMIETMHEANGVGLAGPQVGVMRRLCVVDTGEEDVELVNPEIVEVSAETQTGVEGCLSLPGKYGIVTRPEHVVIRAQDRNGDWYEYEGDDIVARCFLHEIDHLDGHMYTEIAEKMLTPEGQPHTAHTTNPVPCILLEPEGKVHALADGRLADVATTILGLWGMQPSELMTGRNLAAPQNEGEASRG